MKHVSWYGTTCWFCGHSGLRTKTLARVTYKCCEDCKAVQLAALAGDSAQAEVHGRRDADVRMLREKLTDPLLQYWSPARYLRLLQEHARLDPRYADTLRWREWRDAFATETQRRVTTKEREYKQLHRKEQRNEQ